MSPNYFLGKNWIIAPTDSKTKQSHKSKREHIHIEKRGKKISDTIARERNNKEKKTLVTLAIRSSRERLGLATGGMMG